ncbi:hypothetical protein Tco_0955967 [Tanacetum coccineum]|uniref:Uncharacterized protein n=1 Tax=Tanacetum coccineum TaxID=301880 RepID=A0ABQ5E8P1_9ASTR
MYKTPYPKSQYTVPNEPIRRTGVAQYAVPNRSDTPYPIGLIRRIQDVRYADKMDDPNITIEEYIRLEEGKAHRRGKVYNWKTAKYAIVFNDTLTSEAALSCEPTEMIIIKPICLRFHHPSLRSVDDLDFFKDFENEFPAIVYNDA